MIDIGELAQAQRKWDALGNDENVRVGSMRNFPVFAAADAVLEADQIVVSDADKPSWVRSAPDGPVWLLEPGTYVVVPVKETA